MRTGGKSRLADCQDDAGGRLRQEKLGLFPKVGPPVQPLSCLWCLSPDDSKGLQQQKCLSGSPPSLSFGHSLEVPGRLGPDPALAFVNLKPQATMAPLRACLLRRTWQAPR